ncbi:hypothetical protein ADUPG1_000062 [Aduncisulcus paluster]|uniref:Uncharacterized protein n=1 Tax=Aduncisulcus paluster TaxID=2918883 RepID=A0ABQ5K7S5_9EUKA|nr:hypothetical protein ADUPG1_000062 [Aduncisulcus paluster]
MIHLISILCQTDKFSKSNPITEKFSVLVGMSNPHQTKDDETVEDSLSSFPEHIIKQFESCIVPGTPWQWFIKEFAPYNKKIREEVDKKIKEAEEKAIEKKED